MKDFPIYAAGKFIETDEVLNVYNPYNKQLVGKTWLANRLILDHCIEKALAVEEQMAEMPSFQRYAILMQIAKGIEQNRTEMATLLSREAAKPLRYALGEIDRAMQTFVVAAEEAKRLPAEYLSVDWTAAGIGKEAMVKYFPVGLIAGISPFNFPLNLAVHKIAPAIASGNPIILKPARSTPLSVLYLAHIIDSTELPKGAVSLLPTDRETGTMLVTDPRFKKLTFTGSPEVGWAMKAQAGRKKVTLELGGNAGVIVSDSCLLEEAVKKCVTGSFAYSGQVCIHVQRIFVQRNIFDAFVDLFIEATSKLKMGEPENADTDISAMIDEENAQRVEQWVNEAVAAGAKLLHGGKRIGTYFEPTLLTNTRNEMKVCSLEIFGPVVSLEPFDNFETAVAEVNNSEFGLQAGVFTDKISEMNHAFRKLNVGGVIINDVPTFRVDHTPYGGVKNSGFGREGVKYAILEMMEPRLLVKNYS